MPCPSLKSKKKNFVERVLSRCLCVSEWLCVKFYAFISNWNLNHEHGLFDKHCWAFIKECLDCCFFVTLATKSCLVWSSLPFQYPSFVLNGIHFPSISSSLYLLVFDWVIVLIKNGTLRIQTSFDAAWAQEGCIKYVGIV